MEDGGVEESPPSEDLTVISPSGDLILEVQDETRDQNFTFRVSTQQLQHASPYFQSLLDPHKFGEGIKVAEKLNEFKKEGLAIADVPVAKLPRVKIADVGRIGRVNTIKNLVSDFLSALHGLELSTTNPPVTNLANLAIVADRFDALPALTSYVQRKRFLKAIDAKSKKTATITSEEKARQKLLVGLFLDHPTWVSENSKRLILGGSNRWKLDAVGDAEAALWWDIPLGIEGKYSAMGKPGHDGSTESCLVVNCKALMVESLETRILHMQRVQLQYLRTQVAQQLNSNSLYLSLAQRSIMTRICSFISAQTNENPDEMISRRDYTLDTLQSIQSQFLKLYSAGERQCRLGYDSSPQCDSFQLGEMVRFFGKINTLRLEGTLCVGDISEPFYGNIERILERLRQCPAYQIDKNHSHCGLRTRLAPLLNQLEPYLLIGNTIDVGICGECWQAHRRRYAWSETKRPVLWRSPVVSSTSGKSRGSPGSEACLEFHLKVRNMFTASSRDWLAADAVGGSGGRFGGPSTPSLKYD